MNAEPVSPLVTAIPPLLGLMERARSASGTAELCFIMVNETRSFVSYSQAALWIEGEGLAAVSGVSEINRSAPFAVWLSRVFGSIVPERDSPLIAGHDSLTAEEANAWHEFFPAHAIWLALSAPDGTRLGTLVLAREAPWKQTELLLLRELAGNYGLAWAWHTRSRGFKFWRNKLRFRRWTLAALAGLAALSMVPVRLSVLAPAEIVARHPVVVRSPLDGVVDKIEVEPNEHVKQGQVLFSLDVTTLNGRLEVAQRALATEIAEFDKNAQQAFNDRDASAQLGVIRARVAERRAEAAQLEAVLDQSRIRAPQNGVVVLDSAAEWAGRPVAVGEKVLAIADVLDTEVEAWLAPGDMIELPDKAALTLFSNIDPLHPIAATIRYVAYEASERPDGSHAYRVRAAIADKDGQRLLRLGLRGTARLDGKRVPLAYWLMRRPLVAVRQILGR